MESLLPMITRSIIGNNGSIITYYRPGQFASAGEWVVTLSLHAQIPITLHGQISFQIPSILALAYGCFLNFARLQCCLWLAMWLCKLCCTCETIQCPISLMVWWLLSALQCVASATPIFSNSNQLSRVKYGDTMIPQQYYAWDTRDYQTDWTEKQLEIEAIWLPVLVLITCSSLLWRRQQSSLTITMSFWRHFHASMCWSRNSCLSQKNPCRIHP